LDKEAAEKFPVRDFYGVRRRERVTVPSGEGAGGDSVGGDTAYPEFLRAVKRCE
jgi:hypothetical protein